MGRLILKGLTLTEIVTISSQNNIAYSTLILLLFTGIRIIKQSSTAQIRIPFKISRIHRNDFYQRSRSSYSQVLSSIIFIDC